MSAPPVLPLAGTIAAGQPIEAIEDREVLDLEDVFVTPNETFVLRVRGDSMIEDNICDGDYVVIEKRATARDGEIVVALIEDEEATSNAFTAKRPAATASSPPTPPTSPSTSPTSASRA
jgi:repressor LexA